MIKHKIIYPDGSEEIIEHYGMYGHSSGGFSFYTVPLNTEPPINTERPYIFISGANVRKIVPMGEA